VVLLGCLIVKVKIEKKIISGTTALLVAMYFGFKGVHPSDEFNGFAYLGDAP
tara:strand:- start:319 stop:474 length:156 start_codon:yes stop_codon:yes gene_type:complete